ncbi:hypothetical protein DNTS_029645 [Danionella cerebrum]|uniref:Phosphatidylinositol-glycan biosynthesis class X protein n=1 Tax=Danionella cerebrum TaxID=2873325 RepID=A0A553QPN2_9TELE|nr:hypothetical protein DNTS_029645 [Danionella translucida]
MSASMVYFCYLLAVILYFLNHVDANEGVNCFPSEWLESLSMSVTVTKAGFHRDLDYSVHLTPVDHAVQLLIIQKLPSGVYMDHYQLESLRQDLDLEVLLDSEVDVEAPEFLSSEFAALIFLPSSSLSVSIPIHTRIRDQSLCSWLEVQQLQVSGAVGLQVPLGDASMFTCVCVVTLLTTALSCCYLLKLIWRHGTY